MTKYRQISSIITKKHVDFGIKDNKGRDIGYRITIIHATYEILPESARSWRHNNPPWIARTSGTRNGKDFGPLTREIYGDSFEEVNSKAIKRAEQYRAKASKV